MYAFIIILLTSTIWLSLIYIFYVLGTNWKISKSLDLLFVCTVIILETIELIIRLKSNFSESRDSSGLKILLNINRVLRVFMVYRRWVSFSTIVTEQFIKYSHNLNSVFNKKGIN